MSALGERALEQQVERLQLKLADVCEAIGLPLGGGADGYLLPNVRRLVMERDRLKDAVEDAIETLDAASDNYGTGRVIREALQAALDAEPVR